MAAPTTGPSLVEAIARGVLDAELAAEIWLLLEAGLPLVVVVPEGRVGAGRQLLGGLLASVGRDADGALAIGSRGARGPDDRSLAWRLTRGDEPGLVLEADSLEDLRNELARPPIQLSPHELTFLGCVLVLGPRPAPTDGSQPRAGALRVVAAHYVRPLARDAHGHAQELPPAVLATWDARLGRYEHFSWGVLPEIAARLGRKVGDLEADLHHRRDDLGGLAAAGLTSLDEVRRLIAGYRAAYGGHDAASAGRSN